MLRDAVLCGVILWCIVHAGVLLLGWAGIELMAALERWFENDPRFRR